MRAVLILLACLAASSAGCSEQAAVASTVAEDVTSLAGSWRVAAIDGAEFNEPYGLALTGDAQRLWWDPICALQGRRYLIDGTRVTFLSLYPPPPAGSPPGIVCLIAPPAELGRVMRALDAAETIKRTAQNGVLISGGGRSLLLFSQ